MSEELQIMFWDRTPGRFVNKLTGDQINVVVNGQPTYPSFEGSQDEWCLMLVETLVDMRNSLHKSSSVALGPCAQEAINVRCGKVTWDLITGSILYKPRASDHGELAAMTLQREPEEYGDLYVQDDELLVEAAFKTDDGRRLASQGMIKVLG